ncbi:MAG TPA: DUF4173 domain-containing protein [Solirubrobacteraceae bacterium]|nr:DUF4173 domain-containing protein [Solirubrobacteraceae bacterium]
MRWTAAAVIAIATIAALTLVHHPVGLGLTVVLVAVYATAARRNTWWLLAAVLAAVATLRAAAWVVVPALIASVAVASYAASGGASWRQVALGLVRIGRNYDAGVTVLRRAPVPAGRVALRTAAIALVLVAVFLPLFATADAAFAHLLDVMVPVESADRPLTRTALWFGFVTLGGALMHADMARPARVTTRRLERVELAVPLGILVGLFAVFVAFQLATLYGGNDYVLETSGLTYAEYARSGFAQLIAAAALTLAVIAAAARYGPDTKLRRALLGALIVLTFAILASAYTRLHLYEDAYGFTRLRLAADAAILWLGGLFVLVLAAGITKTHGWLPRAVLALSATGILAFAVSNPDARIAERNIDRYERTGRIDLYMLRHLSADAVPALGRFTIERMCPDPDPLVSLNLGRTRARAACAG